MHHFDVPSAHRQLTIIAEAMVDVAECPVLPQRLNDGAWDQLRADLAAGDFWEMLAPSQFAQWTDMIEAFADELDVPSPEEASRHDPAELLLKLNSEVNRKITYAPKSTRVDSPVDDALGNRQGVCQDYAHIMIALVRKVGIPCTDGSGARLRGCSSDTRHI